MAEKRRKTGHGNWWFLAAVLGVYAVLGVMEPQSAVKALTFFGRVMAQVLPALGLVFILLFVADLLLDEKRVRQHLGKQSGFKGWLVAIGAGVLAAGPVYAWYAALAEMRQKGMRDALIAAFLYSRALKLPLLPLMAHYFGLAYTVVLSLCIIIFSLLNGILLERLTAGRQEKRS